MKNLTSIIAAIAVTILTVGPAVGQQFTGELPPKPGSGGEKEAAEQTDDVEKVFVGKLPPKPSEEECCECPPADEATAMVAMNTNDTDDAPGAKHDPVLENDKEDKDEDDNKSDKSESTDDTDMTAQKRRCNACAKLKKLRADMKQLLAEKADKSEEFKALMAKYMAIKAMLESYDGVQKDVEELKAWKKKVEGKLTSDDSKDAEELKQELSDLNDKIGKKLEKLEEKNERLGKLLEILGSDEVSLDDLKKGLEAANKAEELLKQAKSEQGKVNELSEEMHDLVTFHRFALELSIGPRFTSLLRTSDGQKVIRGGGGYGLNLKLKLRAPVHVDFIDHVGPYVEGVWHTGTLFESDYSFGLGGELMFVLPVEYQGEKPWLLGPYSGYRVTWVNLREGDNFDLIEHRGVIGVKTALRFSDNIRLIVAGDAGFGRRGGMLGDGDFHTEAAKPAFNMRAGLQFTF